MVRKKMWNRRRGDKRVETKPDYALIQSAETDSEFIDMSGPDLSDDPLAIPSFENDATTSSTNQHKEKTPAMASTKQNAARIFALVGATGGVGTTCLVTQLAHAFALEAASQPSMKRRPTDPSVCLIDLDFESGACANHLDILPSLTLDDLSGPPEQIDKAFTQALVSTHESGISLLATPNSLGANSRVNPETVMAMLDAAAELYDIVIIDLPRYHQPWTLSVMRAVDVLGITCELTIPSLHAAREALEKLNALSKGKINSQVILSKFERRSFKNVLRQSDAETALGRKTLSTICLDPDTTREALNCGEPAGAIRPESRFVKDVRKLAELLQQQQVSKLLKAA